MSKGATGRFEVKKSSICRKGEFTFLLQLASTQARHAPPRGAQNPSQSILLSKRQIMRGGAMAMRAALIALHWNAQ